MPANKLFKSLLILCALFVFPTTVQGASININPSTKNMTTGETGELEVILNVSSSESFTSIDFEITKNGSSVTFSKPKGPNNENCLLDGVCINDNSNGWFVSILSDSNFSNGTVLVKVPYTAVSTGVSTLQVNSAIAYDSSYNENSISNVTGTYTVAVGNTPTPTLTPTATPTPTPTATPTATPTPTINPSVTPTISFISNQEIDENDAVTVNFTLGDPDTSVALLTLSASSSDEEILPKSNITFGGSGAYRSVTLNPRDGEHGKVTVTLSVSDGVNSSSRSFTLDINKSESDDDSSDDNNNNSDDNNNSTGGNNNGGIGGAPGGNTGGTTTVTPTPVVPATGSYTSTYFALIFSALVLFAILIRRKLI